MACASIASSEVVLLETLFFDSHAHIKAQTQATRLVPKLTLRYIFILTSLWGWIRNIINSLTLAATKQQANNIPLKSCKRPLTCYPRPGAFMLFAERNCAGLLAPASRSRNPSPLLAGQD